MQHSTTAAPLPDTTPRTRLFAILAVIILFSEIAAFELLMVYPAIPHIGADFRTLDVAWVMSIVTLSGATFMPLIGKASDKIGKKRIIVALTVVFILGSILCAVATEFWMLLAGRAIQGTLVGIVAVSYGLVRDIMPRDFVPVALGMVATGIGMSALVGPFIAGWLIDDFGFRAVFWFLAAYVLVLLPLYLVVVPESPIRADRPVDYLGTLLLGPGVAVLLLAVTKGNAWGWTSATILALLAVGVAMLIAFVVRQRTTAHPLIDLSILFGRKFGPTVLAVACVGYMMNAKSFMMPTILQTPAGVPGIGYGAGITALQYALWMCPMGIVAMAAGPVGGILAKRIGPRQVLIASAVLFILGMYLGFRLPATIGEVFLMGVVTGAGIGFLHSANANLVQEALPPEQSGVGATVAGIGMQLASSIAVTVTGVLMAHHVAARRPDGKGVVYADSAFTTGFTAAALVGAVGLVIALVMRHGRTPARGGLQAPPATAPAPDAPADGARQVPA